MKLFHADICAATLLGGWLCMQPPTMRPDGTVVVPDFDAPVSKWVQEGAYDSASQCEEKCTGMRRFWAPRYWGWSRKPPNDVPDRRKDEWESLALAIEKAKCVPAEHIYPARKGETTP